MGDITKRKTITVTYECSETGQKMESTIKYSNPDGTGGCTAEVDTKFTPEIGGENQGPVGVYCCNI